MDADLQASEQPECKNQADLQKKNKQPQNQPRKQGIRELVGKKIQATRRVLWKKEHC